MLATMGVVAVAPAASADEMCTDVTDSLTAAISDGGTFTLAGDSCVNQQGIGIASNTTFTIDLAGHDLRVTGQDGATGKDSSSGDAGGPGDNGLAALGVAGTLQLTNGTLTAVGGNGGAGGDGGNGGTGFYGIYNFGGTIILHNTTVTATGGMGGNGGNGGVAGECTDATSGDGGNGGSGGLGFVSLPTSTVIVVGSSSIASFGGQGGDGGTGGACDGHTGDDGKSGGIAGDGPTMPATYGKFDPHGGNGGVVTVYADTVGGAVAAVNSLAEADAPFTWPTRSGHQFAGWFDAASGGTEVDESSTDTSLNLTLYAHWIPAMVDRYVATDGDDTSNDCLDQLSPCKTISHAVRELFYETTPPNPLETIHVGAGTYREDAVVDASKWTDLTIEGAGAGTTVIAGSGAESYYGMILEVGKSVTLRNLAISNSASSDGIVVRDIFTGDLTLDHVDLSHNDDGIDIQGRRNSLDVAITDGVISGNGDRGVEIGEGPVTLSVTDSTISDNEDGIVLLGKDSTAEVTVTNSVISGNSGYGAEADGGQFTITGSDIDGNSVGVDTWGNGQMTVADSTISGSSDVGALAEGVDVLTLNNTDLSGETGTAIEIETDATVAIAGTVTTAGTILGDGSLSGNGTLVNDGAIWKTVTVDFTDDLAVSHNNYTFSFDNNGGANSGTPPGVAVYAPTLADAGYSVDDVIPSTPPTWAGHDFQQWSPQSAGGTEFADDTVLASFADPEHSDGDAPAVVTLYAQWSERASLTITVGTPDEDGPATLPDGTVGTPYGVTPTVDGGTGPYTWSAPTGDLPPGITLDPDTGQIGGTPTTPGTYAFTITVTDSHDNTGSSTVQITIAAPPDDLTVTTAGLPTGTVGAPYRAALHASGANDGVYHWTIAAGTLPDGLSLADDGVISGTPTATGTFTFTVSVNDPATAELSIVIHPAEAPESPEPSSQEPSSQEPSSQEPSSQEPAVQTTPPSKASSPQPVSETTTTVDVDLAQTGFPAETGMVIGALLLLGGVIALAGRRRRGARR